jgi:Calcineurin-like phosphoesterase
MAAMSSRVAAALARARQLVEWRWEARGPDGAQRDRLLVVGDPQAPLDVFLQILDRQGVLGEDGWLRPDLALLSVGDHFDYGVGRGFLSPQAARETGQSGLCLLRYLAEHAPDHVILLAGNHDLARVMELVGQSDVSFARARELAAEALASGDERRFAREFPDIPSPMLALRDYSSHSQAQRALVQQLLVHGRMKLAHAAHLGSHEPLLVTHAGITQRELRLMGLPDERAPERIADALNARLGGAVAAVRQAWTEGENVPLDLRPLHVAGADGSEGGGLLYHRPAHPERPGADRAWEQDAHAPRRFDPRALPLGLVQACGHSGHRKCLQELDHDGWIATSARQRERGGLRTLRTNGQSVVYEADVRLPVPEEATLYLLDGEMSRVEPDSYPLLEALP